MALDLHQVLGGAYACSVPRAVQMLSEDALVVLAGPARNCYEQVSAVELVVLSTDGRVLARRPWNSTDPGVVFAPGRLALPAWNQVEVVDQNLKTLQTVRLTKRSGLPSLNSPQAGVLAVQERNGSLVLTGSPLVKASADLLPDPRKNAQALADLPDGRRVLRVENDLVLRDTSGTEKTIASLGWVAPACEHYEYCQQSGASLQFQVVVGKRPRVLVQSNGSRIPLTDAAGLLPYFRVLVVDLETGAEVFREEDNFRTAQRSAMLSPDGDVLVNSDGYTLTVRRLP